MGPAPAQVLDPVLTAGLPGGALGLFVYKSPAEGNAGPLVLLDANRLTFISSVGTSWFQMEPLASVTLGARGHWVRAGAWAVVLLAGGGRGYKWPGRGGARQERF